MLRRLLASLRPGRAAPPAAAPASPPPGNDPLRSARDAYRDGRYDDVVAVHAALPAGAARPFEEAMQLAHSLQYLGRFADAESVYAQLAGALAGSPSPAAQRTRVALHLGLSRLRRGELDGARAAFETAVAASPERGDARRILAFPDVMAGEPDLPREALPPMPPAGPASAAPFDVAYFFVAPDDPAGAQSYWTLLEHSIASARRVYPGARVVLMTDERTAPPQGLRFDTIVRAALPPGDLMANRFRAGRAYLDAVRKDGGAAGALFTEADCVMQRDARDVLTRGAHLYLTYRSDFVSEAEDLEPCNTGVMLLDLAHAGRIAGFFDACIAAIADLEARPAIQRAYERPIRAWRGDQLAVGAVLGWRLFQREVLGRRTDRLSAAGCTIGLLPSDLYNFAPGPRDAPERLATKYVLHYKGDRKRALLGAAP